jgi:four helix bundle protein
VGANCRVACRAKFRADFISKLKIVEEECDESTYWMELLISARIDQSALLPALIEEAQQILSIIVASNPHGKGRNPPACSMTFVNQKEGPTEM